MTLNMHNLLKKTFLLMLFSLIVASYSFAQINRASSGKDFYIAFGKNDTISAVRTTGTLLNVELILRITSLEDTEVTLSFTNNTTLNETITVPAGTIKDYQLSRDQAIAAYLGTWVSQINKSIHVTATNPITLVAINSANNSVDATLVWPVESWGTEYYNIGIVNASSNCDGFFVIAKENNTQITFTHRTISLSKATLNTGDVYHYYSSSSSDTHGMRIVSDKPVAVFNSNTKGKMLTSDIPQSNYNFEQLAPTNQWGKKFILPNNEINAGFFRIYAKEPDTKITYTFSNTGTTDTHTITSSAPDNGTYDIIMDDTHNYSATACYVTSDKPVGICAFQKTTNSNTSSAPSSAWLPPVEQTTRNVYVSPLDLSGRFVYMQTTHYMTIIVPTASKSSTTVSINGAAPQQVDSLPNSVFSWKANNIGNSGYSYGQYYFGSSNVALHQPLNTTLLVDNPDGIIALAFSGSGYITYFYTAGSSYRDLTAGFKVNGVDYIDRDWRGICNTSSFTFDAYPDALTNVTWKINGEPAGSGNQLIKNDLPDGLTVVEMLANNKTYTTHLFLGGIPVVWSPYNTTGDERYNWDNRANWNPAVVPNSCNTVFIPGNLDYYPNLTGHAECNNIYFIQGSELGRPDLLTYKKAYVQYNFGLKQTAQTTNKKNTNLVLQSSSTADRMLYSAAVSSAPIKRERWYMLSSPLKDVVTGDLGFGGFPLTFLKKFELVNKDGQDYPVGNWTTPYNSMVEEVAKNSTNGFAFFMYGYGMTGNDTGCEESGYFGQLNELDYLPDRGTKSYGIEKINGILELPFFADSTNLYAHRTQVYDTLSNTSTFYYVAGDSSKFNSITNKTESVLRKSNKGNYRFTPESYNSDNDNWIFETQIKHPVKDLFSGEDFLAGNPYMSSINMVEFLNDNSSSVDPQYKIWNGENFESYTLNATGDGIISNDMDASPYISPMQGFFLTYKSGDVIFDVEKISTVRPEEASFNLRSAQTTVEENILRIKAESKQASSRALIGHKTGANNGFVRGEDVRKLFTPLNYVPEIYSLAGDMPVDINFINDNGNVIIPLGIKTQQAGEIKLTFTGMDRYFKASKIELIDAKENKTMDLTGKSSYVFSFNHTETGIRNGRFSLRISGSTTSLPDISNSEDLKVYGDSKGIYVVSSEPVQKIEVYDLTGRKLYESASNARYYPLQGNYGNAPLIVKVMTNNNVKTLKINP